MITILNSLIFILAAIKIIHEKLNSQKVINDMAHEVNQHTQSVNDFILVINDVSHELEPMDMVLRDHKIMNLIVIMDAPRWMLKIKEKKWGRITILGKDQLLGNFSMQKENFILYRKKKNYKRIDEVLEFINHSKKIRITDEGP
ncbi:hypothetical protein AAXB25_32285 [Paenibacillus lautus]|uniref:hypothetical protein n=1 Tax=Paenibacillus lautus TaxID=1401 RepID=UPI003D29CFE9